MSIIHIRNLVVEGRHGVHPHERAAPQKFSISVELSVDTSRAAKTDDIDDTVNWSWVRNVIIDSVQDESFNLLERLAQVIAERILANKNVAKLTLSIDKLEAFDSGVPGITIEAKHPA
jgi:dihydroneopterin aldolase